MLYKSFTRNSILCCNCPEIIQCIIKVGFEQLPVPIILEKPVQLNRKIHEIWENIHDPGIKMHRKVIEMFLKIKNSAANQSTEFFIKEII